MALMGYDQQEVYQDLLSEYEQERSDADKRNELLTKEREAMPALLKKKRWVIRTRWGKFGIFWGWGI